jgi:GTPase Era involved in 16S rRNA processing
MASPNTITLSLISHTNAGKTTLARTLLRRDVGEVRDAAHVTQFNESHALLTVGDHQLRLWDTPGFGDTSRLLKRLKGEKNPLTWFVSQTWDRLLDKPLWCSQQALHNVREEADIVLYLVNASEAPEDATYVQQEMEILGWTQKPVLVLLNQTGPPRHIVDELAEQEAWRNALQFYPCVKAVLQLDAFTSCWVQEDALMSQLQSVLSAEKRPSFQHLQRAWHQQHMQVLQQASTELGHMLADSAQDGISVRSATMTEWIGIGRSAYNQELATARQKLSTRLVERMQLSTNALIQLHQLAGSAEKQLLRVAHEHFQQPTQVSESIFGALGGVVAGAMAGLWADLHAGGMTFGGGALVGSIGGGLSAYAMAKGYNLVRGDEGQLHWSREHFHEQVRLCLLCYLAVAHYGRGRGEWQQQSAIPEVWSKAIEATIEQKKPAWDSAWKQALGKHTQTEVVQLQMVTLVQSSLITALRRLYPQATIGLKLA